MPCGYLIGINRKWKKAKYPLDPFQKKYSTLVICLLDTLKILCIVLYDELKLLPPFWILSLMLDAQVIYLDIYVSKCYVKYKMFTSS